MKKAVSRYTNLIKNSLGIAPVVVLILSLTSVSFHNEELDVEFNKELTPREVEEIVDRQLTEHQTNNK